MEIFAAYWRTKVKITTNFRAKWDLRGYLAQGVPVQITGSTGERYDFYSLASRGQGRGAEGKGVNVLGEGAQRLGCVAVVKIRLPQV